MRVGPHGRVDGLDRLKPPGRLDRRAPNPVTGKQVTLVVDRYELGARGRVAIVDLGTPAGVDNVDAYRMMIRSFRWR